MREGGAGARRLLQLERGSEKGVCENHCLLPPLGAQSQDPNLLVPMAPGWGSCLHRVNHAKPWLAAVGGEDSPAV